MPLEPHEEEADASAAAEGEPDDAHSAGRPAPQNRSAQSQAKERRVQLILDEFGVRNQKLELSEVKRVLGAKLEPISDHQWRRAFTEANAKWAAAHATGAPKPWSAQDTPELEWAWRIEAAIDKIYHAHGVPLPALANANAWLPPSLEHLANESGPFGSLLRGRGSEEWRGVQRVFIETLFPGEAFDLATDSKAWNKYCMRYGYVLRAFNDGAGPVVLRKDRRNLASEFRYTPEEAKFCDAFDAFAKRWETAQMEYGKLEDECVRCDVCLELKPPWMTTVRMVLRGSQLDKALRDDKAKKEKRKNKVWDDYVDKQCVDKYLCDRCRAPSQIEKDVGFHKFSESNHAHLKEKVPDFPVEQLRIQKDPYAAFAIAWDAELALVRMTIPWYVLSLPCDVRPPPSLLTCVRLRGCFGEAM